MKRNRCSDTDNDENEDKQIKTERIEEDDDDDSNNQQNCLQIIIDDDKIERILGRGTFYGVDMFRFERLNGNGQAVIPIDMARIKYPFAVIDFYERHIVYR